MSAVPEKDAAAAGHPEPRTPLSARAQSQWRLESLVWGVPLAIVALVVAGAIMSSDGPTWPAMVIVVAALTIVAVGIVVVPPLRASRWRYDVRPEEIDLRHGTLTIVRTIVPMARVQHVATERTFFSQVFQTATLVLHTAAGAVKIPALDEPVAAALRDRIGELARTPDDD